MTGNPLLDIDTPEYVTLAQAMEVTGRSRRTILRWYAAGKVERTWWRIGQPAYNLWDLQIAVRDEGKRRARPRWPLPADLT
jgi:hypothetical protein